MSKQTYHVALYSEALHEPEAVESYTDPARAADRYDMLRIEASRRGGDWRAYKGDKAFAWPTPEEIAAAKKAEEIAKIQRKLSALDSILPRHVEDLYEATGKYPSGIDPDKATEAAASKAELRAALEALNA